LPSVITVRYFGVILPNNSLNRQQNQIHRKGTQTLDSRLRPAYFPYRETSHYLIHERKKKNDKKDNQIGIPKDFLNFSTSKYTVEYGRNSVKCSLLRSLIATASLGISKVSSWVRVLTNLAGFPAQSSPVGILLPGGTTDPASRIAWVSTKEPSIRMECCPIMHSGSIVQDRRRLYAPTVTYLSIDVSAGRPDKWKRVGCGIKLKDIWQYDKEFTICISSEYLVQLEKL
jgi:hypothetical protein